MQTAGEPMISVDTKKKELVGNYKNNGTDYRRKGEPVCVKAHDFEEKTLGQSGALRSLRRHRRRGLGGRRDHGRHGGVRGPAIRTPGSQVNRHQALMVFGAGSHLSGRL